ncbi:hypothetical protein [uncultured Tenacibaculum sp.]|uniref:hypothetical protein n=1 Tax=uncultured Tenacibaculum sp. TaxID=174713 RepID=UPI00261781C4|nr:hypothetical protein [uncultured Tenacibaculum sp.]
MEYLSQFFPSNWIKEHNIYGIEFTKEISIGFIERIQGGYSYLSIDEFQELQITPIKLLETSIERLKNSLENCDLKIYKTETGKICFWGSENDNFSAVRILIPEYQKIIKENIGENFNFSIPSRDIITCWKTTSEKEDNKFKRETEEDFNDEEYNLSKKIYTWTNITYCKK